MAARQRVERRDRRLETTSHAMSRRTGEGRPLLEVDGLLKAFGGLVAVNDLSFAVNEGEIVGLIEIGRASCRERV